MTSLVPFFSYWLKMLLLSAVLLGYYRLFLRKTAVHPFNRYYLLASVFLALVIPLWTIPLPDWTDPIHRAAQTLARPHGPTTRAQVTKEYVRNYSDFRATLIRHARYLYIGYGLLTLVLLWPLVRSLHAIRRLKRNHTPEKIADLFVYSTREAGTPFSFFNHLFWNETIPTDTEKGQLIFRHELYHIRQLHTIDLLALETARRLFWCNPFFYLTLRELKAVHEFLADRFALQPAPGQDSTIIQRTTYAEYLVWQSQGLTATPQLVHFFYQPELKKRITMILQPSPTGSGLTRWLTAPLAILLLFAFTARHPRPYIYTIPYSDDPVLQNTQLNRFFIRHIRYPQTALEQGLEGTIWYAITLDASGHIQDAQGGNQPIDTQGGKIPTLTITSRPPDPQQRITARPADTARSLFVRELMEVGDLTSQEPVAGCPHGTYYFSVVFKIERPAAERTPVTDNR